MTDNLPALIQKMEPEFAKTLGKGLPSERFTRIAITAIKGNPNIANLERISLMTSIMQAAQDGLVIDGKEAAIVPFKGKATYIPMVAGLIKKMRQATEFASLSHGIIYQGEVDSGAFEYVKGDIERLTHKPMLFGNRGEPIGAYAIVTTKDGAKHRAVLTKEEIEKRMNAGRAGQSGPWQSWTDEMWIKTAIRAVYKIAPNSGDGGEVLEGIFAREDDAPSPVIDAAPAEPAPEDTPAKRTRTRVAAKIVEADVIPPEAPPAEEDHDEDGVVIGAEPPLHDEELPM